MKSIRYSVAVVALLAAISFHAAPSYALTEVGATNKIGGALFNQTTEERAVSNLEKSITQKQLAKEKLQAQLAGSGGSGLSNEVGLAKSRIAELNRVLSEASPTMTSQEYQSALNSLNRAKSQLVTLQREEIWANHRRDQLLREIERKDKDIAALDRRLVEAKSLAADSRTRALVSTVKDLALDKAREVERTQRNDAYAAAREAVRDSERRESVGYVYESIQRKSGSVNGTPAPYSRESGSARVRQGGGSNSDRQQYSGGDNYALDFSQ